MKSKEGVGEKEGGLKEGGGKREGGIKSKIQSPKIWPSNLPPPVTLQLLTFLDLPIIEPRA